MIKSRNLPTGQAGKKNKLKSYLTGIILFFSITLLFVLSSQSASAASSRVLPTAYVVHTYGNDSLIKKMDQRFLMFLSQILLTIARR